MASAATEYYETLFHAFQSFIAQKIADDSTKEEIKIALSALEAKLEILQNPAIELTDKMRSQILEVYKTDIEEEIRNSRRPLLNKSLVRFLERPTRSKDEYQSVNAEAAERRLITKEELYATTDIDLKEIVRKTVAKDEAIATLSPNQLTAAEIIQDLVYFSDVDERYFPNKELFAVIEPFIEAIKHDDALMNAIFSDKVQNPIASDLEKLNWLVAPTHFLAPSPT